MTWNKKGGKKISKAEAMTYVENYQKDHKDPKTVRSIYYDKEHVQSVLDTPGCVGVQIYFGKNGDGNVLVIFPVDENGKIIDETHELAKGQFSILEVGNPCPPYCA